MLASDYPSGASFMFLHLFVFPLFLSGKRKKKDGKKEKLSPHLRGCLPGASAAAAAQTGKESQGDVKLSDGEGEERERERERKKPQSSNTERLLLLLLPCGLSIS